MKTDKNTRLFECITPLCQSQGWEFSVITEVMVRKEPLLNNLKLLYRYASLHLTSQDWLDCYRSFRDVPQQELQAAARKLHDPTIGRGAILKLLFIGVLETDLMVPINGESWVKLVQFPVLEGVGS